MLGGVGGHVCPWATWIEVGGLVVMPQPPQQCRATPETKAMAPWLTAASAIEADLVVAAGAALVACADLNPFDFCYFC